MKFHYGEVQLRGLTTGRWSAVLAARIVMNDLEEEEQPHSLTNCRSSVMLAAPKELNAFYGEGIENSAFFEKPSYRASHSTMRFLIYDVHLRGATLNIPTCSDDLELSSQFPNNFWTFLLLNFSHLPDFILTILRHVI